MLVVCSAPTLWLDLLCLWILSRLSEHQDWVLIDSAWSSCPLGQMRTSKRDDSIHLCSQKCAIPSETQVKCALSHLRQPLVMKYPSITEVLLYLRLRLQAHHIQSLVNYSLYRQFVAYVYLQYVHWRAGNLIPINTSDYHIYYCCLDICFC